MARRRRKDTRYVHYQYPDGVAEGLGSVGLRGNIWHVRFFRDGREIEESSETNDRDEASLLLLSRWREEQRKGDADALLKAHQRRDEFRDQEVRKVVSHGLFDAIVDQTTRASHRALEGAVAPWDWWEGPGKDYVPLLGFGCRCALIGVTSARARRMVDSGEAFDLTHNVPEPAQSGLDPRWQTWSVAFLRSWENARKQGLEADVAMRFALEAASTTLVTDLKQDLDALRWVS